MKLVATKSFNYNTRRLQAGDIFESKTNKDGILLIAVRKARNMESRPEEVIPAPKNNVMEKLATGGLTDTKIPTFLVGEKPSEQTIVISKEKEPEHNVAKEANEKVKEAEIVAQKEKEKEILEATKEAEKSAAKLSEEKEESTKDTTHNIVVKQNANQSIKTSGRARKN